MATVTSMTSAAITAALAGKADLAAGVVPDAQAPSNTVKKDSWVVDLNDHGGVGDGVASNDAAFISALAAINPTWGGKIVVRAGSYLISGATAITLSNFGTIIEGAGSGATNIVIGAGFTDTAAIKITGTGCAVRHVSVIGNNVTTTSNPVSDAIYINSVQKTRITDCHFRNINGWAVQVVAGSAAGTNPVGTLLRGLLIRSCAAGIHFLGNITSGTCSSDMTDIQVITCGTTTGASANLDGVLLEDASDINAANILSWMSVGTGHALHLKGKCTSNTVRGVNFQGSTAGSTVLVEDGANGSSSKNKILCGTVQLGTIGIRITGASSATSLLDLDVINNTTHGISVEGTGNPFYGRNLYFVNNGSGASGTNYDVNWTGSSIGTLADCRFETTISVVGVAGVQKSVNVPSLQNVRCWNMMFSGSGASSTNWFSNTPNLAMETSSGFFDFMSKVNLSIGLFTQGNINSQPSLTSSVVLSSNITGSAANDTFRITGDGNMAIGPAAGTGTRDSTWGRQGTAQIGTPDSDIIIGLAGKGLRIKEGTNARMGTATLVAGTVTVANTSVTANTRVILGVKTPGATPTNNGALFVSALTIGTGFTVKSTNASDVSVISYVLFEAA